MEEKYVELLKRKCDEENYKKLMELNNPKLHNFIAKYVELCNPVSMFVRTDSLEDIQYIRDKAKELEEETQLLIEVTRCILTGALTRQEIKRIQNFW